MIDDDTDADRGLCGLADPGIAPDYSHLAALFGQRRRASDVVCDRAFTPASVGLVNRLVNGGSNGYHDRQAYAAYLMRLLTEDTSTDTTRTVVLPAPSGSVTVNFSRT